MLVKNIFKYRPEVDGLRALALLSVVFFHAGYPFFSGGFVGVDVFFVISGYLITSIIVDDIKSGNFSYQRFYERRARRILPALYAVVLLSIPFAWYILSPRDMNSYSRSVGAVVVFGSNINFWRESGYFSTAAELKPLLHTWSLAVEEQFYLFFPAIFGILYMFGMGVVAFVFALVLLSSLALSQWASIAMPSAAFYLLPTRAWELMIGAFAALYFDVVRSRWCNQIFSEIGALLGLLLIGLSVVLFDQGTLFPGLNALPAVGGALFVILFASNENIVGRFLGHRLMVGVGLVSYSAYLIHQPLFAFLRRLDFHVSHVWAFNLLPLGVLALAYLSWRYIESPFRDSRTVSTTVLICSGVACSIVLLGFSFAGVISNGFEGRYPAYSAVMRGANWPEDMNGTSDCKRLFGVDQYCRINDSSVRPSDILIGDSHANHFYPGLAFQLNTRGRNLLMVGAGGCPPFIDVDTGFSPVHGTNLRCHTRMSRKYKELLALGGVNNVFISFSADAYFDTALDFKDLRGEINFGAERSRANKLALIRTVKMAQFYGKQVYLIEDLPDVTFDRYLECLISTQSIEKSKGCLKLNYLSEDYKSLLSSLESYGVKVIRTSHLLKNFPYTDHGDLMYRDSTHLSKSGSLYFGEHVKFD